MYISEKQMSERLNSPRNLANLLRKDKVNYAKEDGTNRVSAESKSEGLSSEEEGRQKLHESGIQHREIKRPGNNRPWLSQQERTRIYTEATESSSDGDKIRTQTEIARTHGIQVSTVSDIVNNVRRVDNTPRSVDQKVMDAQLDAVREKAIDKLMAGLGQLTEDKISAHNAKDISSICANMAKVVQQTIPQEKTAQPINLIVYTPELRAEKNFDIVEI